MRSIGSASSKTAEQAAEPARSGVQSPDRAGLLFCCGNWQARLRAPDWLAAWSLPRPRLLLLMALLLVALCAILALYGRHRPDHSDEFDLIAADSSFKLKSTSAEAPKALCSEQPIRGIVTEHITKKSPESVPSLNVFEPQNCLPAPPQVELAPAATAVEVPDLEPRWEEYTTIRNPHRGGSPMMTQWKTIGSAIILAAAFTAPIQAEPTDLKDAAADEAIGKQLAELKKSIDALSESVLKIQPLVLSNDLELKELKKQMAQLQKDLDDLRKRNVSLYPPTTTGTGRLRLVNTYFSPMTIIVNDKSYQLQPNETRVIDALAAGAFTFEVLGVEPVRSRVLRANETYTINVHPR